MTKSRNGEILVRLCGIASCLGPDMSPRSALHVRLPTSNVGRRAALRCTQTCSYSPRSHIVWSTEAVARLDCKVFNADGICFIKSDLVQRSLAPHAWRDQNSANFLVLSKVLNLTRNLSHMPDHVVNCYWWCLDCVLSKFCAHSCVHRRQCSPILLNCQKLLTSVHALWWGHHISWDPR